MTTKLFKDVNNNIYSYPLDGSQDDLIGDKVAVTQAEADALIEANFAPQRQEILNSLSYVDKRLMEYPPIGDQLDALWKGGTEAALMRAKIEAVKNKYPKS
jgi:hypothetical protein